MPILQPVPIKTRDLSGWRALLVWFTEARRWKLIEAWTFVLPDETEIMIPAGFVFDGASIPRPFWWLLSPIGLLLIPGLVHDFAYANGGLLRSKGVDSPVFGPGASRFYWDRLFRDVAIQVNGFTGINYGAWIALVLFGWSAWNWHRRGKISLWQSWKKKRARGE